MMRPRLCWSCWMWCVTLSIYPTLIWIRFSFKSLIDCANSPHQNLPYCKILQSNTTMRVRIAWYADRTIWKRRLTCTLPVYKSDNAIRCGAGCWSVAERTQVEHSMNLHQQTDVFREHREYRVTKGLGTALFPVFSTRPFQHNKALIMQYGCRLKNVPWPACPPNTGVYPVVVGSVAALLLSRLYFEWSLEPWQQTANQRVGNNLHATRIQAPRSLRHFLVIPAWQIRFSSSSQKTCTWLWYSGRVVRLLKSLNIFVCLCGNKNTDILVA